MVGVFGKPTVVNNVETLACLPHIVTRGARWFASIGRPQNTGPKLYCVSGHVKKPGVYELPLGVTFREIIEGPCGGMRDGHTLKAFFPGGSSAPIMTAAEIDVKADFDACAEAGTMLGSGGVIVLDETVDMVETAANLAHFYAHESCGQCTPCREGADWAKDILDRIVAGHGRPEDPETLLRICRFASQGMTICPLGDAFSLPISSIVKKFPEEFARHIQWRRPCRKGSSPSSRGPGHDPVSGARRDDMPKLTIDGRDVEVPAGTNLIEAARAAGVEVPYFCYHPYLSIVGQCRICMVEIVGQPRLAIACATPAADGMVVQSETSERVREARDAVMEFLLANHPLDCPVCDQAGECLLQDHSSSEQGAAFATHMVETRRTFPGYERRLIGPHVIQNQNRCIHCSRCIRFTHEISETAPLTYKSRGNSAYIDTFDGEPFTDPLSACAADVCPVGALTVRDFRFRKRAWKLRSTPSVCPGCSIGCNIWLDHHERVVYRVTPRENPAINATWLCDHGRFLADSLNDQEYLRPQHRAAGQLAHVSWSEALRALAFDMKAARTFRVVASANLSNEELFLARELFGGHLKGEIVVPVWPGEPRRMKNGRGGWLHASDAHPNSDGARRLGLRIVDHDGLSRFLYGAADLTVILDPDAHPFWPRRRRCSSCGWARRWCSQARAPGRRGRVLAPAHAFAGIDEGTFTSSTGAVQRVAAAFEPPGEVRRTAHGGMSPAVPTLAPPYGPPAEVRPLWLLLTVLARELGVTAISLPDVGAVFALMASREKAFAGLDWAALGGASHESLRERHHVG